MSNRLMPYGSADAADVAKVGKSKTPHSLASRMPSPEVIAKVGKVRTPRSLAARMPSVQVAAKIGLNPIDMAGSEARIIRRNKAN